MNEAGEKSCNLRYEAISEMSRAEIERHFRESSVEQITLALLSAALYLDDLEWVKCKCLEYLQGPEKNLRFTALTSLSHLARLHGTLDLPMVLEHLDEAARDPELAGRVEDVRNDIDIFITRKIRGSRSDPKDE